MINICFKNDNTIITWDYKKVNSDNRIHRVLSYCDKYIYHTVIKPKIFQSSIFKGSGRFLSKSPLISSMKANFSIFSDILHTQRVTLCKWTLRQIVDSVARYLLPLIPNRPTGVNYSLGKCCNLGTSKDVMGYNKKRRCKGNTLPLGEPSIMCRICDIWY